MYIVVEEGIAVQRKNRQSSTCNHSNWQAAWAKVLSFIRNGEKMTKKWPFSWAWSGWERVCLSAQNYLARGMWQRHGHSVCIWMTPVMIVCRTIVSDTYNAFPCIIYLLVCSTNGTNVCLTQHSYILSLLFEFALQWCPKVSWVYVRNLDCVQFVGKKVVLPCIIYMLFVSELHSIFFSLS